MKQPDRITRIEVLFTPADFQALKHRSLKETTCVVFDVLRATSSMVTALKNGSKEIMPVATLQEAVETHQRSPKVILAGERDGLRIKAELTGGIDFHLGNSPREFTPERVQGRVIVMTTTNGTRALKACLGARRVLVSSLLNLNATASAIRSSAPRELLIVCSGTFEEAAYEDVLGAGALCDALWDICAPGQMADSARMAHWLFKAASNDLTAALGRSRNGSRLLGRPELADDVAFCANGDSIDLVAELCEDGIVRPAS
jgi:2-phosphosulfolactate phosphatase